jgi:drug/metabolite transporter, DME family
MVCVDCSNNRRIYEHCDDLTPTEFKAAYNRHPETRQPAGCSNQQVSGNPGAIPSRRFVMPKPHRPRSAPSGVILVCIAGALWGTAPIAFEFVHKLTGLGAIQISDYRLAIAAVALIVALASIGRLGSLWEAVRSRPLSIAAIGAGVATYQALWFAAITQIGVSIATVISLGIAPVLITLWESWRARRRPPAPKVLAVAAAIAGLALVCASASAGNISRGDPIDGLLLASGSGFFYSVTTLVSRRIAVSVLPMPLSAASSLIGALCLLPFALLIGPSSSPDPRAILPLIYLGLVTMAVASLLFYSGLRTAHASTAAVATLLEPVTAALFAVVLLAEPLTLRAAVGIGLILIAVATMSFTATRNTPN